MEEATVIANVAKPDAMLAEPTGAAATGAFAKTAELPTSTEHTSVAGAITGKTTFFDLHSIIRLDSR
jgi:hypothetical protein